MIARTSRSETLAVVFDAPEQLRLCELALDALGDADVLVAIRYSGISSGTERLLYQGRMPPFPGLAYPLVPGYESVGDVIAAGPSANLEPGQSVFVAGARCFGSLDGNPVRGLFGGTASHLVLPAARAVPVEAEWGDQAVLLALAATAQHALSAPHAVLPDLIVGHGVLGRLLARLALAAGAHPVVWETQAARRIGQFEYPVIDPAEDDRRDYASIYDASGDPGLLDPLIARLRPGGEIVLAGFYATALQFNFAPAFMREARMRVAAEWKPADLAQVLALLRNGALSMRELITHRQAVCNDSGNARAAYRTAFGDPACLKMVLDWSNTQ